MEETLKREQERLQEKEERMIGRGETQPSQYMECYPVEGVSLEESRLRKQQGGGGLADGFLSRNEGKTKNKKSLNKQMKLIDKTMAKLKQSR